MKITNLTSEKGFTVLTFNDGSLSPKILSSIIYKLKIKKGDDLTPQDVDRLFLQSETKRAKKRAVYYLSRSNINSGQLKEKLSRHFSENVVNIAVEFCQNNHFLNDEDYAKRLLDTLILQNKSQREIKQKLILKKVDKFLAEQLIYENFSKIDDFAAAENLLIKKYAKKAKDDKQKAIAALMRKGFSYDTAKSATEKFLEEQYEL